MRAIKIHGTTKKIKQLVDLSKQALRGGDKHLIDVSGYNGIEVLTPRRFFEKYLK